jgi:BirA family biotin operon repressor/biotin-[acetyl-CoA-carboxylase] ligase
MNEQISPWQLLSDEALAVNKNELLKAFQSRYESENRDVGKCPVHWYHRVDSTMEMVRRIAENQLQTDESVFLIPFRGSAMTLVPRAVVLAQEQTSGVGRRGRRWQSNSGVGAYMTIAFEILEEWRECNIGCWPLVVGCAVQESLSLYGSKCRLKWPNDVVINPDITRPLQKLAGILVISFNTSSNKRYLSTGIGINVLPNSQTESVNGISLHQTIKGSPSIAEVAGSVLASLFRSTAEFSESGFRPFYEKWEHLSVLNGRQVQVECGKSIFEGTVKGINLDGALLLASQKGDQELKAIYSGEVSRVYVTSN